MKRKHLDSNNRLRNVARFLPIGVWFVLVTYLSLVSGNSLKNSWFTSIQYGDKIFHLGAYFVASLLLMYSLGGQVGRTFSVSIMYTLVVCVLWGGMIEYLQKAISTGRHFDVFDIIANIIGVLSGIAVFKLIFKKRYYGS